MSGFLPSSSGGGGGSPSGSAGGDLGGTYPNPTVIQLTGSAGVVSVPSGTSISMAAATPASTTGDIRVHRAFALKFRNNANGADKNLVSVASDVITIGDTVVDVAVNAVNATVTASTLARLVNSGSGFQLYIDSGAMHNVTTRAIFANLLGQDALSIIPVYNGATVVRFGDTTTSGAISFVTKTSNNPPGSLSVSSQAPFASATGVNRNPGSINITVPNPISGGADGYINLQVRSTTAFSIGYDGTNGVVDFANSATQAGGALAAVDGYLVAKIGGVLKRIPFLN